MQANDQCECGGTMKKPEDLGMNPEAVASDGAWVWQLKEALICDQCGGHYLIKDGIAILSEPKGGDE